MFSILLLLNLLHSKGHFICATSSTNCNGDPSLTTVILSDFRLNFIPGFASKTDRRVQFKKAFFLLSLVSYNNDGVPFQRPLPCTSTKLLDSISFGLIL